MKYVLEVVLVTASTACLLLAAIPSAQPALRRPEPLVPIGVSAPAPLARDREQAMADLEAIRALRFNSIRVAVEWSDAESGRGRSTQFDALDGMLTLAGQSGLKVMLQLSTASLPPWVLQRYPDGRFVSKTQGGGPRTDRICLDHPGVRADVAAYVAAATDTPPVTPHPPHPSHGTPSILEASCRMGCVSARTLSAVSATG